jgi:hypothetical protein
MIKIRSPLLIRCPTEKVTTSSITTSNLIVLYYYKLINNRQRNDPRRQLKGKVESGLAKQHRKLDGVDVGSNDSENKGQKRLE